MFPCSNAVVTRPLPPVTAKLYALRMDHLTPKMRSWNMSRIRGTDTKPEILVRSMLHRAGYRFRKNVSTLPSILELKNFKPDRFEIFKGWIIKFRRPCRVFDVARRDNDDHPLTGAG